MADSAANESAPVTGGAVAGGEVFETPTQKKEHIDVNNSTGTQATVPGRLVFRCERCGFAVVDDTGDTAAFDELVEEHASTCRRPAPSPLATPTLLTVDELPAGTLLADSTGAVALRVAEGVLISSGEVLDVGDWTWRALWPVVSHEGAVGDPVLIEAFAAFVMGESPVGAMRERLWRDLIEIRNSAVIIGAPDLPNPVAVRNVVRRMDDLDDVRQVVQDARPTFPSPTDAEIPAWATEADSWEWQGSSEALWLRNIERRWRWPDASGVRLVSYQTAGREGEIKSAEPTIMVDFDELTSAADARDVARWLAEAADLLEQTGVGDDHDN